MKRVVLDTNVLVSSVLGGTLEFVLDEWLEGKFILIASDDILEEYIAVLNRPRLHLSWETIEIITANLLRFSEFVVPEEQVRLIDNDPSDNMFLEAALAGKADCIVSGDEHLLAIGQF